jgi:hypothetical protein
MVADDHLEKFARDQFIVESGIPSVEAQERSSSELGRGRHKNDIVGADAADDRRAQLLIAAPKDESLRADRST